MQLLNENSHLWDETQEAVQQLTQAYSAYKQGMSEHTTMRFALKVGLYD